MEQNQKFVQDIQEAGAKIQEAFERLGSALQKLANKARVIIAIANSINCDATLRKWYEQLETAREANVGGYEENKKESEETY